ncbi:MULTISPECIES: hypothetical protein [Burkholderia]|uniref:hypothetical protein n=1 Tax=Burkholderia TaxID=32008 RepID=UPI000C9BBB43|nr:MULTISPECIES: hypothetical protein [unclassified Burkholderia]
MTLIAKAIARRDSACDPEGNKTLAELVQQYDVHPNQITEWKKQLQERVAEIFGANTTDLGEPPVDIKVLHARIEQLMLENAF